MIICLSNKVFYETFYFNELELLIFANMARVSDSKQIQFKSIIIHRKSQNKINVEVMINHNNPSFGFN